jgi:hypothetical protein
MNSERDSTRIVRSWLESGSTAIPDRVVNAVLAELPSRPQRRSRWSLRRSPTMKFLLPIVAAGAAVAVLAVVLGGQFLRNDSIIGAPSSITPSAPAGERPVSGQVSATFGSSAATIDVDGSATGSALSGTAKVSFGAFQEVPELEDMFLIGLQCARQLDDTTWILGGVIEESTHTGQTVGSAAALIVRDSSPQQVVLWFDDAAPTADCPGFVEGITDAVMQEAIFSTVHGSDAISLP